MKHRSSAWLGRKLMAAVFVVSAIALILALFGYRSEIVGSICKDGWVSDSVGQGTCSYHGGPDKDREVSTLLGQRPVGWVGLTRWPLLILGLLGATASGIGIAASSLDQRFAPSSRRSAASLPKISHETTRTTTTLDDRFLNLHVRVMDIAGARQTFVTSGAGYQASAEFVFEGLTDRGARRLNELLDVRRKRRFGSNQSRAVEALGDDLFAALFPPKLDAVYRQAFDEARQRDVGLRLVLELDDATADLPWEYLHDSKRASFLALSSETSVIRVMPVDDETRTIDPIDAVRILVVGASPIGLPALDIAAERDLIRRALTEPFGRTDVVVKFADGAGFEDLRASLEAFRPHIFYFAGHGTWDSTVDDGALFFETEARRPHRITGRELGVLLVRSGLRLVLLNSCNAARSSQHDRFAGIANSLVAQGVPAVLAMQFPIEDRAASMFGSTFLQQLLKVGSIDAALNEARQAVFTTQKRIEWGTPVLTTRVPVERVLPVSTKRRDP